MKELLLVGCGGFVGSISRYWFGGFISHATGDGRFPIGTLVVNLLGCLLIGFLAGLAEHKGLLNTQLRLLLITGVLGGFTTFSAFSYESIFLIRSDLAGMAALYVGASVVGGLVMTGVGLWVTTIW